MTIVALKWSAAARALAAAVAATLLMSCGQNSPEGLMNSAKEYLAKGDRNAAVIQLKNLLSRAPDNGEARLLLGEALLEDEDYVSAEKELSRALELKQPQEKALPLYVRALLSQGKNKSVIAEVEKYKLFNPQAVAATQTALGDAHMRLGSRARALEAYGAAVAAVPGYPRARLGEARLLAIEGKLDEAIRQADEIIVAEPKLAEGHAFRAELLLARGDLAGGRKALEDAIAAESGFLPARLSLISLLTDQREFDAATKLVESTSKVASNDLRVTYLGASLAFHKREMDKARELVQTVLRYLPEHLPSLVLAGAIDLQEKRLGAAEANLRKAVALAPNHSMARRLLVRTYLAMGQPVKAKEVLQPLVDRDRTDDPQLQLLAGETYLANGDLQRATAFYQAAAKHKGGDVEQAAARTRLGQLALTMGRAEEGFKELETASGLDTQTFQADLAIIAGHLLRREPDKALEAVEALERKQPNNPLTFQMHGVVNLAKRDPKAARKSFERALEIEPTYLPSAYNLAQLDILENKPEDARKRYEAMISRQPGNEQLLMLLGELQARTGATPKEVGATFQRAVAANPQAPAARVALINFHLRYGEPKVALTVAQEALAALPSDPSVLDAAGVAQETAGEINQAIGTYNQLASLQEQAVAPLYRLAVLYARQKDTEKAIESLRRIQKVAPRDLDVVPQLVQIYAAAGRYEEALREARELQKRAPKFAGGWSLEGDVRLAQRDFAEAERLYRDALKRDPKANAVAVKLHVALVDAGKTAAADAWSRTWIAENPRDSLMHLYLGERNLKANKLKASAAHFKAVVDIEPTNVLALNNLAWISGELNDSKSLDYAERALKVAPNNAAVLDTYGMLLLKNGEVDKALTIMERAHGLAPARNDLRVNYAKALLKAGRKNDARKELEALQAVKENFRGKNEVAGLLKGL
jgi:putative PEP-CTERM system TPR-repeat lipoprotein